MNYNRDFAEKLRSLGLRPTIQRIQICKVLFDREKTFHFTIQNLSKIISDKKNQILPLLVVHA